MNKPKLFLLDIDRTLTNTKRDITARTVLAVKNLIKAGYYVSLCTGRLYSCTPQVALDIFDQDNLHIFGGGGNVATTNGVTKVAHFIPSEVAREVCLKVDQLGGRFIFGQQHKRFVNQRNYQISAAFGKQDLYIPTEDKKDWSTSLISIGNINEQLRQFFQNYPNITAKHLTNYAGQDYFDVTAVGVTKGLAAQDLFRLLKVEAAETVAVGDSDNDLEVIQLVGHGVAMGNATQNLKQVAAEVIDHTEEEGLAKYLEKFI